MSGAARPKKPLVLVSDDVEPPHWDAAGEDEVVELLSSGSPGAAEVVDLTLPAAKKVRLEDWGFNRT